MSRSLPGRPSAEHLRKEARRLQRACRTGQVSAIRLLRAHLPRLAGRPRDGHGWHTGITVQEAQFTLARDYGFESWPRMMAFVEEQADQLRFGDSIKRILELARAEAARGGGGEVGSGHLLLALAGDEMRPVAGPLLEGLGVAREEVLRGAGDSVSTGSSQASEEPPRDSKPSQLQSLFGPAARRTVDSAAAEARGSGAGIVQCEHFLLGLLKDPDAVAARVLEATGLSYESARKQLTGRASPR